MVVCAPASYYIAMRRTLFSSLPSLLFSLSIHLHSANKWTEITMNKTWSLGFPGGAVVENLPANAGDTGSSPGLGRSHMPQSN